MTTLSKTKPAVEAIEVTPSNTTVYNPPFRSLYIGVSGDVKIQDASGNDVTFAYVPVGFLPVEAAMVYATGTSASSIVGLR
jgi:hypothetical protein